MATFGIGVAIIAIALLCIAGLLLSCLSVSGTWLVLAGAVIAALLPKEGFPGWWTVAAFAVLAVLVEVIEFMAGYWGVRRQAGSRLAGFVALIGGLAGLLLGALVPLPVVGPLLGMLVVSFVLVFIVERRRLRASGQAARIATGAVAARVLVVLIKVAVTLGMSAALLVQMLV